jgi:hypothetical protein
MYEADYGQHAELSQRYKNGANWFYWIAGLSIVTSIIAFAGGGWGFLISLGTTQVIDAIAAGLSAELGGAPRVVALVLDLLVTGAFVAFGVLAGKKFLWAYIIGLVAFLLDGLVSLLVQDWLGVVAHAVVLFIMFRGFQAGRELTNLEQAMAQQGSEPASQPETV